MVRTVETEIPEHSKILTPDQLAAIKLRNERAKKRYWALKANKPLGNFYFIPANENFEGLSPETVTRLIFLNTYLPFDDNRLMKTQRTQMKKSDLPEILNVSKSTVKRFWQEVNGKYIVETDEGLLFTNNDIFRNGKLQKRKYGTYQKFYINAIRKLYKSTDKHKHLGYIFQMLPYINFEYNIICKNPEETTLKKIEHMTLAEFCDAIHFDISHINRLLKIYKDLTFAVNDKQERFCAFVYDGLHRNKAKIFVNPHILYCGSDYKQVKILASFCND